MPTISFIKVGNHYEIDNPEAHFNPNDIVDWFNNTNDETVIFFPDHVGVFVDFAQDLTVPASATKIAHKRVSAGSHHTPIVRPVVTKVPNNNHRYAVYCEETRSFAVGHSEPQLDVP